MKLDTKNFEEKMKKSLSVYEKELGTIRAGRANPSVLDKVLVEYYGAPTPINQIATVRVADARTIAIQPFKASDCKAIEKAINSSDLGMPPQSDGKVIRLIFPALTEDRRRDLTKQIEKMGEDVKVALRNIRREANDMCKTMKKKSEMTEDEQKSSEKAVQDLTDKYIKELDKITEAKVKEIMTI
ncbi:MAG: ribosome recycling factor [Clostridia bacterium]|nr:ribosome recycling factor [Clostridia bacterium]